MGFEKYINIIACYLVIQFHFTNAMKLDITPTIAVLGGTGKTGSECVYQALKSGMRVVILARDPSKLVIPEGSGGNDAGKELKDPNLIVVSGSVTKQEDVDKVFEGQNISGVVIALGGRTSSVGTTMLTCGTTCVVNAMKRNNVKRVAVVTSLGTGDSKSYAPWKFKILMLTVMKKIFIDKNNQEKIFLDNNGIGNDLEYCIIRPGGLGVGPPTGVVNVKDGYGGSIYRSDLASFCLKAVTDKNFPYIRKSPCVSSIFGTGWKKDNIKGFDAATTA